MLDPLFNKYNNTGVCMLDSIFHDVKNFENIFLVWKRNIFYLLRIDKTDITI